ncbi:MAG: hypothetical protein ABR985_22800 [Methanotrichaceae archaeon]|jgi:ribosomal protein L40E
MEYRDMIAKETTIEPQNEIVLPTSGLIKVTTEPVAKKTESISFKFCRECGAEINAKAEICPKCGVRTAATSENSIAGYIRRFSTEDFIAECIERFWGLSSFLKIVTGFLTSLFIAPIFISIFILVSSLFSVGVMYGAMYGARNLGFAAIFAIVLVLLGWIGAILIESTGFVMIVYGVRDVWREKKV